MSELHERIASLEQENARLKDLVRLISEELNVSRSNYLKVADAIAPSSQSANHLADIARQIRADRDRATERAAVAERERDASRARESALREAGAVMLEALQELRSRLDFLDESTPTLTMAREARTAWRLALAGTAPTDGRDLDDFDRHG